MIHFKKARWRNLMRYGQTWTEIQLDRSPSTMILGKNGHGKSAILEAICFGLFGKPYRKIKKGQLINTKNGKDLLVELEFDVNGKEYLVRRGMRPDIFEVIEDGVVLTQAGGSRDYQKMLELDILRMDYPAACQIVFVGKAQHTTFMQLNAFQRRQFIEVLLNLVIFSKMSTLHSQKNSDLKGKISELKTAITIMQDKVRTRRQYIADLESAAESAATADIDRINARISIEQDAIQTLLRERAELIASAPHDPSAEIKALGQRLNNLSRSSLNMKSDLRRYEDERSHLTNGHVCYACKQEVGEETRLAQLREKDEAIALAKDSIESTDKKMAEINLALVDLEDALPAVKAHAIEVAQIDGAIRTHRATLAQLEAEVESDRQPDLSKLEATKVEVAETISLLKALESKLQESYTKSEYFAAIAQMLNDKGLKAMLIRRFIPIINHIVNEKLVELGLFAKFTLDENFDETIMIGVDQFNYYALSEGEKLRIDMALLIAWREIAKLQGNVSTNLLFFDEVFDSSLDSNGAEALGDLMNQLEGLNAFIITHTPDKIMDKVRSIIKIERVNGFSKFGDVTELE